MPILLFCRRSATYVVVLSAAVLLASIGCDRVSDETIGYINAINVYYGAHPACLWPTPVKFPARVEISDTIRTFGYDTLVDEGLLIRSTSGENGVAFVHKQTNNYDLSVKGRAAWTAESARPGYGNFCYGHRRVSRIDTPNPTSRDPGTTTEVAYSYTLVEVPAWAIAVKKKAAFPDILVDLSGVQTAFVTLAKTNNGWQVSPIHPGN